MPITNNNTKLSLPSSVLIVLLILVLPTQQYTSPSSCNSSTNFYNYLTHNCQTCPNRTAPSTLDITYCNCTSPYYANPDSIGFMSSDACLSGPVFDMLYRAWGPIRWHSCMGKMDPSRQLSAV